MIDAIFSQPTYLATKKMLDATALRHEAIASNIAHIESPNYKRIDVAPDFSQQLNAALGSRNAQQITALKPSLTVDTSAAPSNRDGNTVQLETELLNLNQNTLAHALETQLVTGTLLRMRMAITGRQ